MVVLGELHSPDTTISILYHGYYQRFGLIVSFAHKGNDIIILKCRISDIRESSGWKDIRWQKRNITWVYSTLHLGG
jgi:hypothetical protein